MFSSAEVAGKCVPVIPRKWSHSLSLSSHPHLRLLYPISTNNHDGNVKFRKLVNEHKLRYAACPKIEKPSIAREVVALWRKMQPPGRFLAKKEETMENRKGKNVATKRSKQEDEQPVWVEVGDKKAQEKASQVSFVQFLIRSASIVAVGSSLRLR